MTSSIGIGSILIADRPFMAGLLGSTIEPYAGNWSLVRSLNGFAVDRTIRASGWHFIMLAGEIKASSIGSIQPNSLRAALRRIFSRVREQDFNCLEVTGIVARHFLGVPYVTISAQSRHIQPGGMLDPSDSRRAARVAAEWAKG
jgi:hypothetical protein